MIDFKFLDMHTDKMDLSYLDPLIGHYLQTRKFHVTIVESKKNIDYFILYIVDKYPQLVNIINKLHNEMITIKDFLYPTQNWLNNRINFIKLDFNLLEDIKDINYLYDIIVAFCFFNTPQAINIVHIKPKATKNGKIKVQGKLFIDFLCKYNNLSYFGIFPCLENEIFNEINKTLYCCGAYWTKNNKQIHLEPYYYNLLDVIDNQSNEKLTAVKTKLKDLGYQFIESDTE